MTPEQERDYQEALRRIKEAAKNKSFTELAGLDLSNLQSMTRLPPKLARLTCSNRLLGANG